MWASTTTAAAAAAKDGALAAEHWWGQSPGQTQSGLPPNPDEWWGPPGAARGPGSKWPLSGQGVLDRAKTEQW